MNKYFIRILAIALAAVFLFPLCTVGYATDEQTNEVTVLFTHDMHSHFLPTKTDSGTSGGYARIMTLINEQKQLDPNAVLVDGGDFSMGSLFQTAYATDAMELRLMGAMGYDAVTLGNHEFDYLQEGFISMLNAAVDSGDTLPPIVEANYLPHSKGEEGYNSDMVDAANRYGIEDYILFERGGTYFIIFGILGSDSDNCAPNSGMKFLDPVITAQKTVEKATKECLEKYNEEPFIICLSHSGTEKRKGEDYDLAKKVDGIDLIISAHSHSTLTDPLVVNDTVIVSAGDYGKQLGTVRFQHLSDGEFLLTDYCLITVDDSVPEDKDIALLVDRFKLKVEKDYLSAYNTDFNDVLVYNGIHFEPVKTIKSSRHESTVCNLFTDGYKYAAEKALHENVDVAFTMAGTIRESLPLGNITTYDVFCAAPLGVGSEGVLMCTYITGRDLKNAMEIDASVQPDMKAAQLYFSGVEYSYNKKRIKYNRVDSAALRTDDKTLQEIDDEKLYRVVCGIYTAQVLQSAEDMTNGKLTVTFRDRDGSPLTSEELSQYVITDESGKPLTEWYAIASYLKQMGGEMDEKYLLPDGRKNVYSSFNPVKLLSNANKYTYTVVIAVIFSILAIVAVSLIISKTVVKKRRRKYA